MCLTIFRELRKKLAEFCLRSTEYLDCKIVKKAVSSANARSDENADAMSINTGKLIAIGAFVDELGLQARAGQRLVGCVARNKSGGVVLRDFDTGQTHFIRIEGIEGRPD